MFLRLEELVEDRKTLPIAGDTSIPTLASKGAQISRSEIESRQKSRGLKRKSHMPHIIPEEEEEEEGSRRKRAKKP